MRKISLPKGHIILISLLSIALGFSLAANIYKGGSVAPQPLTAASPKQATVGWESGFADIADLMAPSVVTITSEKTVTTRSSNPFEDFFGFDPFGRGRGGTQSRVQQATGSGVIVRSDGYIITNNHVVDGADKVTVRLNDGRELEGTAVVDPRTDLALVKIDADNLTAAGFADSDKLRVGEWAIAIGTPFQLKNTVTVGVISAIRTDSPIATENTYMQEYIQTDASINPGNSGGPLVNVHGQIIGINFMIYSKSGGNMGIGFAIPSNTVKYVMNELIKNGKVTRGYLGLGPADLDEDTKSTLGVSSGVLVESIEKGTPAYKAGIRVKDVIVKIGDEEIKTSNDLRNVVQRTAPGTKVDVEVVRNGEKLKFNVEMGEMGSDTVSVGGESESTDNDTGMVVSDIPESMRERLGLEDDMSGVLVREVQEGSPAGRAGIRSGYVITEIGSTPVRNVTDYKKALRGAKKGRTYLVTVFAQGRTFVRTMKL